MKTFTLSIFALIASLILSTAALGQIAQRGTSTNGISTNTSLTINKPTGVVAGDIMIVNIGQRNNGTTAPTLAGWTAISSGAIDGGTTMGALLYKVAGGSEPASYTFTLGAGANNNEGTIVAFSGVNTSTPFDVAPGSLSLSGANGTTATATSITTVTANAAVIMFAQSNDNQAMGTWNTTSPGALTQLYSDEYNGSGATDLTVGAAWAIKGTAGATGSGTVALGGNLRWGAMLVALRPAASATLSPSATQSIFAGGTVNFTATAVGFGGSGNYTYTWTAVGAVIPGSNPNSIAASSDSKTLTFPTAGSYTVSVSIARTGETTRITNSVTVNVSGANLWASSSSGTQISNYTVSNGTVNAGPTNHFAPTFPGTTTGGTTTAAIGRNDIPSAADGYFYWLPNTGGNGGVVEVFAATASGGSHTRIGSIDVNGGSTNSLGFVRLGMGPDGTGWILAGDGTTLYIAYFASNGVNPVTLSLKTVSLVGGSAATFQNGDVAIDGNNTIYALANDGSGLTQIFVGTVSNPSVTLTQKWNLVDNANANFSGTVNGVAFDALGSLYISTSTGLFFINQATVNGPAGTVQCVLAQAQTGLQDLASNVFPTQSTLPVKLTSFTVSKQGTSALLKWVTANEINNDHFDIERSSDGINFAKVGTIQGNGTTNTSNSYQFADPLTGVTVKMVYYRLRDVAIDGKASYSKIVSLRLDGSKGPKNFSVYPNPFTSNIKLNISSEGESVVTIRISNLAGQQLITRKAALQNGDNIVVIDNLGTLKPGVYIAEMITPETKITQKLIRN